MSKSLVFLSKSLIHSFFRKKTSDSLRKAMSKFPALDDAFDVKLMKHVLSTMYSVYHSLFLIQQIYKFFCFVLQMLLSTEINE